MPDEGNEDELQSEHRHASHQTANRGKAVTLELFFDLVFVFAFTQVTAMLAADLSWSGLGRGLAVLALLWWAWVGYSWLGSAVDPETGWVRIGFLSATVAMFIVALATATALSTGAVTFAISYLLVRLVHVAMFVGVSRDDPAFRRAITTMIPSFTLAPTLLVLAAFSHGAVRGALWTLALTVDFGGPLLGGSAGWRLSPAHFAERHGLIVIIALGEAIVAVGAAEVSDAGVPWRLALAGVCAVTVAGTFWWLYFDVVAIAAERRLQELRGRQRNNLARDSYSYLHLPIVASIVLVALAGKKVASAPLRELATIPTVSLGVGSALYLVSLSCLRWRNYGSPNVPRLVAAPIIGMTAAVMGYSVSGLAGIATLAGLLVIFVTFEAVRLREQRHQIRYHEAPPT